MLNIVFLCHGNICRSPMAEYIMKNIVKDKKVNIISRALSDEEIGNNIYPNAIEVLNKHNIPAGEHRAKKVNIKELDEANYIIVMDNYNLTRLKYDRDKVYKLKYFINSDEDILDPWYTRDFDTCFEKIEMCCQAFYKYLLDKKEIS